MAETVAPSVRGRQRVQVVLVLASAATVAGGLAGFGLGVVVGVPASWFPPGDAAAAALVAVVVLLDARGVRPPAVGRQVPQAWARLFPLPTAALLYGARLGVGPLTMLNTWLWWGAALLGAVAGVWWSTAVGAGFGLARVALMSATTHRADDMPARMAHVRRSEPAVRRLVAAIAMTVAVGTLAACTRPEGGAESRGTTTTTTRPPKTAAASTASPVVVDESVLLAEAGTGFTRVPDESRPGLGPLDLATAARAEVDVSAERSLLETRKFRGGHARAWRSEDGDEVYAAVYEFAEAAGAAAYLQDGLVTLDGRGVASYSVEEVPGATGFSQAERRPTGSVTSHAVVFSRGARFFLVVAATARPGSSPGQATALAQAADLRQAAVSEVP